MKCDQCGRSIGIIKQAFISDPGGESAVAITAAEGYEDARRYLEAGSVGDE